MDQTEADKLTAFVKSVQGKPCWNAYASVGNYLSLGVSLGEKSARDVPLPQSPTTKRLALPDDIAYHKFRDEVELITWCPWRLDAEERPITSSDDETRSVEAGIRRLIGAAVERAEVAAPAWDLQLFFSNQLCLRVFSEYVPGKPPFDGNWGFSINDDHAIVGPGNAIRFGEGKLHEEIGAQKGAGAQLDNDTRGTIEQLAKEIKDLYPNK